MVSTGESNANVHPRVACERERASRTGEKGDEEEKTSQSAFTTHKSAVCSDLGWLYCRSTKTHTPKYPLLEWQQCRSLCLQVVLTIIWNGFFLCIYVSMREIWSISLWICNFLDNLWNLLRCNEIYKRNIHWYLSFENLLN